LPSFSTIPPIKLHVEMPHLQEPPPGLTHQRKRPHNASVSAFCNSSLKWGSAGPHPSIVPALGAQRGKALFQLCSSLKPALPAPAHIIAATSGSNFFRSRLVLRPIKPARLPVNNFWLHPWKVCPSPDGNCKLAALPTPSRSPKQIHCNWSGRALPPNPLQERVAEALTDAIVPAFALVREPGAVPEDRHFDVQLSAEWWLNDGKTPK